MNTVTTEEIFKKAIVFEELSRTFYKRLQEVVLDEMTKNTLDYLAREEIEAQGNPGGVSSRKIFRLYAWNGSGP